MDNKTLSERDICTKYITPAVSAAGWDVQRQIREEVSFTAGRVIVRGKVISRGKSRRADCILYYKPSLPLAVIEAKDNTHSISAGMQQALSYADALDVPFVFSSSGDGFLLHDRTGQSSPVEHQLSMGDFPSPEDLWDRYRQWKGLTPRRKRLSRTTTTWTPAGRPHATTNRSRSTAPWKPSPRGKTSFSLLWRPVQGRPTPPS